jgi:glyoxylase-like metal-dependent hydrolase (beta-lactamase superfamily II)
MIVKTLPVGQLEANCYIIADEQTGHAMIIDPGDEPDRILDEANDLQIDYIFLTHAHFDHAGVIGDLKEATSAEIILHPDEVPVYESIRDHAAAWGFMVEAPPPPDILMSDGDELLVGGMGFVVVHTPGHSPGSMCLYGEGAAFTGDTLFAGSVGRSDLPGGNMAQLKESFRRLMAMPGETRVFPGHGPATSIGHEMKFNMFAGEFLG